MKSILVTGFEPFRGEIVNPSWEVARIVDKEVIRGTHRVTAVSLPTAFANSPRELTEAIARIQPDVVVCLGEAGGRSQLTPERVAINLMDARIPDNDGQQPIDSPVVDGGPTAYWSTLPIKRMVAAIRDAGVPAAVSNTAGTYVCNSIFYSLMHHIASNGLNVRGGFMHVPYMTQQVVDRLAPSLSVKTMADGLRAALTAIVAQDDGDIRLADGQLN